MLFIKNHKRFVVLVLLLAVSVHTPSLLSEIKIAGGSILPDELKDASIAIKLPFLPANLEAALTHQNIGFKPFEKLSNPTLNSIVIDKVYVRSGISLNLGDMIFGKETEEGKISTVIMPRLNFTLGGEATLLNQRVQVSLSVLRKPNGDYTVLLAGVLPINWKISDSISSLKNSVVDSLTFTKVGIVVSDNILNEAVRSPSKSAAFNEVVINPGFNLMGEVNISGAISMIRSILPTESTTAMVFGSIGLLASDLSLTIKLDTKLSFKGDWSSRIQGASVALQVSGKPSISLNTALIVKPTPSDEPLRFICSGVLKPIEVSLSGTMEGTWKNAFAVNGLKLSSCALQVDINYAQFALTGFPSGGGLTGNLQVGGSTVGMALHLTENLSESILYGKAKELSLKDIAQSIGIPRKIVPPLELHNIEFYVVPGFLKPRLIGTLVFPPGLSLVADIDFGPLHGKGLAKIEFLPPTFRIEFENNFLDTMNDVIKTHLSEVSDVVSDTKKQQTKSTASQSYWESFTSTISQSVDYITDKLSSALAVSMKTLHDLGYKTLDLFNLFNINYVLINLTNSVQEVTVRATILDRPFEFNYGIDVVTDAKRLIAAVSNSIVGALVGKISSIIP